MCFALVWLFLQYKDSGIGSEGVVTFAKSQSTMSATAQLCYPLTPLQLRKAHDLDWQCCARLFNMPLRVCSTVEQDNVQSVISDDVFKKLLQDIEECWEKWTSVLQVFYDEREAEKGWRLRVHPKYPLSHLYIPPRDRALIGWSGSACMEGPSAHLYSRSPCADKGYLGGIISLANQNTSTVEVIKDMKGPASWKVYLTHLNLKPGQELFWNYGRANLPIREQWSLPCCAVVQVNTIVRGPRLPPSRKAITKAKVCCLLCGSDLTPKSETRRTPSNFKGHYARCHLRYFSRSEPIIWDDTLYELEIFHAVIAGLKSKNYTVRFCSSPGLQTDNGSNEAKFEAFQRLFNQLRALDVLLLKGDKVPQSPEDLELEAATSWTSEEKEEFKFLSFTSSRAKAEYHIIDKIAEGRMWNIINHQYII